MTPDEQKAYDALTPTEQASFDAAARDKEAAEQATLPYKWTQDLATVTLTLDVPTGTRAKDLAVELKRTAIKVSSFVEGLKAGAWEGRTRAREEGGKGRES